MDIVVNVACWIVLVCTGIAVGGSLLGLDNRSPDQRAIGLFNAVLSIILVGRVFSWW